jgi:hypothetical protein
MKGCVSPVAPPCHHHLSPPPSRTKRLDIARRVGHEDTLPECAAPGARRNDATHTHAMTREAQ